MPTVPNGLSVLSAAQSRKEKSYINFAGTKDHDFLRGYPGAFSAVDIYPIIRFPGNVIRALGSVAAISVSTHRDVFPVSSMPYVNPRGFTQGHRTIAGTMIFHTIDKSAFGYRLKPQHQNADELPLFDILITYVNDSGMLSYEELSGIRILDFGKTVSLENLNPIESYSYMALDYKPLRSIISGTDEGFLIKRSQNKNQKPVSLDGTRLTSHDPLIQGDLEQLSNPSSSWGGESFAVTEDAGGFSDINQEIQVPSET
jgi:hypothetical protein